MGASIKAAPERAEVDTAAVYALRDSRPRTEPAAQNFSMSNSFSVVDRVTRRSKTLNWEDSILSRIAE